MEEGAGVRRALSWRLHREEHLERRRSRTQRRSQEDPRENRHERHQAGPAGKPGGWEIRWVDAGLLQNRAKASWVCVWRSQELSDQLDQSPRSSRLVCGVCLPPRADQ